MHALNDVLDLDLQEDRLLRLACQFFDALLQRGDLVRMLSREVLRFRRVLRDVVELDLLRRRRVRNQLPVALADGAAE